MKGGLRRTALRLAAMTVLVSLAVVAREAQAQLVRGTVREAGSGAPLAGVVVALHPAPGHGDERVTLVATLTNAQGEFAVTPHDTGHFVVSAKRIGVRQFRSAPIALARGATHRLDITLEGLLYSLPTVTVSGATPCRGNRADQDRIAALWEEARAALTASELSLRDRLFRASMTRYERVLEPRSLSVRSETRSTTRGVTEHAFVSTPAESLAAHGYARILDGGVIEFFAPDERVLLSELFVREHCFGLAPSAAEGEVGITFEPVRSRRLTDIAGTLWLDAKRFELRRLTFRYTNFPMPVQDSRTGGEVHFARLATGAWHVSRWFMRAPLLEMATEVSGTTRTGRVTTERPVIASFTESGGTAVPDDAVSTAGLATLSGFVMDSTGTAPLPGGVMRVAGLPNEAPVRADGSFRLPQLPPGRFTLIASHPDYDRLGLLAGEQVLTIDEGKDSATLLKALGTTQILRQLCGYDVVPDTLTALRILVPPPTAADSAARRTLHLVWGVPKVMGANIVRTIDYATDLPVDLAGGVTLCTLPRQSRLRIEERLSTGAPSRLFELRTPDGGFAVVQLRER